MEDVENLFHPSLENTLMKLDPEDGQQILEYFRTHALLSREKALLQASVREQKKLLVENAKLKKDIEQLRGQLQDNQRRRRAKAPPPRRRSPAPSMAVTQPAAAATAAVPAVSPPPSAASQESKERGGRRRRARPAASGPAPLGAESQPEVTRLDLRVGRILSARRHPVAVNMWVQEVDVGEAEPRTAVSTLASEPQELAGSLAVLLCNQKACKLRGVVSQARLLCCSAPSDDTVELLAPPTGSAPGDRVTLLDYPGQPDRELPPRQRVWERVRSELRVNGRGVASYRGSGLQVRGKGLCRAPSLTDCPIR
ncbi:aminoacyl tRNA synthase complex-interacting multifunctional protein 1 [Salarias fasciatus]|uniref:Aminoacyl tRNA synthase complex-interacting multifunctional protein 1-like n=1 Tax=Salarias fasciatus TaxID=181472 RepID=A0A672FPS1_SALFA|nr:aminoacyl tRNA synthase complex-interacting multifunctional protein 1-like [Salarias fasciatus]